MCGSSIKLFLREVSSAIESDRSAQMVNTEIMAQAMKFESQGGGRESLSEAIRAPYRCKYQGQFQGIPRTVQALVEAEVIQPDQEGIFVKTAIESAQGQAH